MHLVSEVVARACRYKGPNVVALADWLRRRQSGSTRGSGGREEERKCTYGSRSRQEAQVAAATIAAICVVAMAGV